MSRTVQAYHTYSHVKYKALSTCYKAETLCCFTCGLFRICATEQVHREARSNWLIHPILQLRSSPKHNVKYYFCHIACHLGNIMAVFQLYVGQMQKDSHPQKCSKTAWHTVAKAQNRLRPASGHVSPCSILCAHQNGSRRLDVMLQ